MTRFKFEARTITHLFKTAWQVIISNLNFYRTHLLFFTFTPLIFSGIFYASNGRYKISYVDSLFNCVSAITVCGLATINLSSLTHFQQAQLFFLMCIGNPVIVSWVIVYLRRYFFAKKFEGILEAAALKKAASVVDEAQKEHKPWPHRLLAFISGKHLSIIDEESVEKPSQGGALRKLRPDMIRRMDDAPKLVNPSGWVSEDRPPSVKAISISNIHPKPKLSPSRSPDNSTSSSQETAPTSPRRRSASVDIGDASRRQRRLSDPGTASRPTSPTNTRMQRFETVANPTISPTGSIKRFPRTQTIEFAPDPIRRRRLGHSGMQEPLYEEPQNQEMLSPPGRNFYTSPSIPMSTRTHGTTHSNHLSHRTIPANSMTTDYGGFPSPFAIAKALLERLFPGVERTLTRTVTMPATMSLSPSHAGSQQGRKHVPYISFDAVVGRNSTFHLLTKEQLEELGGVEYRALNALLWIVATYHVVIQLIAFAIIAPYVSTKRWKPVFDEQIRPFSTSWFAAFQVVSAYTNTGTSLVDQSMAPFQSAYPMIIVMILLVLAGNTAFPIFLRFMIWCISKVVSKNSRGHETLHFLLDHPRRCFIYLFPSHQTWFLLTVVLGLSFIDWFFFLVLDLNTPEISSIPPGIRVLDGLFQAAAVRAAGFGIIPLAALVPAVKVLYVVMMYISVYPIAMSVRSTNVYEERSLGVFHPHDQDGDEDEEEFEPSGSRMTVWSRYLTMHARKQLAFDMWWLALSLFLICIIEKNNLEDPSQFKWFNIFSVIFELVSAYGTVGLSLGIPDQNYSFSGAMHPLSKLIICVVMLRGRHRGLPVAIDRAIMLPSEFKNTDVDQDNMSLQDDGRGSFFYDPEPMNNRIPSGIRQRARRASKLSEALPNEFDNEADNPPEPTLPSRDSKPKLDIVDRGKDP